MLTIWALMVTIYKILQVIVAPQKQGGPNGGYFYANNGMIDIEEDQELKMACKD